MNIAQQLYDNNAAMYVLSSLIRQPLLLSNEKYAIVDDDFTKPMHKLIFSSIFNLEQNGSSVITPQDIDLTLKQYPKQYAYYETNNGYEFVLQCYRLSEGSDLKMFDDNYERLKKFSILRDFNMAGFDTRLIYNTDIDFLNRDEEDKKLNKMSMHDIVSFFDKKLSQVEEKHTGRIDAVESQPAQRKLRELVNEFIERPEVGIALDGDMINFATRGARKGKFYCYSAPSGGGKSRTLVGNACSISLPYINENNQIIVRKDLQKVLYVATEQQPEEIQTLILSFVSGVNEEHILLGNYSPEEKQKIDWALDILDIYGDNFIIDAIPDPNIDLIRTKLRKYIINDQIQYIFYDYIFTSPGLVGEFGNTNLREDVVLMMLSNSLKEIAMIYDVFVYTATQLNDNWSKVETGVRDQNCLRGSKAIADKMDIGEIGVRLNPKEQEKVQEYIDNVIGHKPNLVIDIYKNRRGRLTSVKIFRYFDYGTCHAYDIFATDGNTYKLINDQFAKLIFEENEYEVSTFIKENKKEGVDNANA